MKYKDIITKHCFLNWNYTSSGQSCNQFSLAKQIPIHSYILLSSVRKWQLGVGEWCMG